MNEQHEQYEYARSRVRSKKRLYIHFVWFVLCSVFFFIANKILNYGAAYDWYIGAILLWGFIWIFHAVNVFVINPFMGKEWQRKQTDKLIKDQEKKVAKLKKEIDRETELMIESEKYAAELRKKKEQTAENE